MKAVATLVTMYNSFSSLENHFMPHRSQCHSNTHRPNENLFPISLIIPTFQVFYVTIYQYSIYIPQTRTIFYFWFVLL